MNSKIWKVSHFQLLGLFIFIVTVQFNFCTLVQNYVSLSALKWKQALKLHCLFLSTDYVAGGELFTHLYQREHFNENEVRIYIAEIILALEQLHKVNFAPHPISLIELLLQAVNNIHNKRKCFGIWRKYYNKILLNNYDLILIIKCGIEIQSLCLYLYVWLKSLFICASVRCYGIIILQICFFIM